MTSYSLYNYPTTISIQRILENIQSNKDKQKNDSKENNSVFKDNRLYIYLKYLIFSISF